MTNSDLELLKRYIKGALDWPVDLEKGVRMEGYEAALHGVLDFINSLERPRTIQKTG